jgi:CRP-like cAMP-binding protein
LSTFLQSVFQPANFTAEERAAVCGMFVRKEHKRNGVIVAHGTTHGGYCYVEQGVVRSFVLNGQAAEITTGFIQRGSIVLDWTSFFLQQPSAEWYVALTPCVAWHIEGKEFFHLFNSNETFRNHARTTFVQAYAELRLRAIGFGTLTATERYVQLVEQQPQVVQSAPLKHIATFLGITDTSLSRIRKELTTR